VAATVPGEPARQPSTIVRGSSALSASLLVVAAGGALFWAIAARVTASVNVGQVAALSSAVAFLVYVTAFGLVPMVARYGGGTDRSERVVHNRALLAALVSSAFGAVVLSAVSRAADIETFELVQTLPGAVAFVLVAAGASTTVLVEIRLLSQRRYRWIIGRSASTAIISVVAVTLGPVEAHPLALFLAGSGVMAVSGPMVWWLSDRHDRDRWAFGPAPDDAAMILRYLSVSWTGSLVGRGAPTLLPLVVALQVSSEDNARFFVAWNIALIMFLVVQNVGTTLLTDGGRTSALERQTQFSLVLCFGLAASMTLVAQIGAPLVEIVYGADYGVSVDVLRMLSLSAVPLAFYTVSNAVAQIRHMSGVILGLPLMLMAGVYLPVVLMDPFTILDAPVAWLVGSVLSGVAGYVLLVALRDRPFVPIARLGSAPPISET
jgi:O-antigen/teichoic acid export membrane protein